MKRKNLNYENQSNRNMFKFGKMVSDSYTKELLVEQYTLYKLYAVSRKRMASLLGVKVRMQSMPEDVSENIIKFIIHNKIGDRTSRWDCKKGDLLSETELVQECKSFTSTGPSSFSPRSDWDVIYFLDARRWLDDIFILYRVNLKKSSEVWKNIKVNSIQTFNDQCVQGRRPRITWKLLYPQISEHCVKVFEGSFDDIFI
jgi:hypothetical protein